MGCLGFDALESVVCVSTVGVDAVCEAKYDGGIGCLDNTLHA